MRRTLTLVLLLPMLAGCGRGTRGSGGVGEAAVPRYRESPMLRERVEQGELPPVEERLPAEPLVVQPVERPGDYR